MAEAPIRRLIAPRSIVLIGAGSWTDAVAAGNAAIGYTGELWRVHPTRASSPSTRYFRSVEELPGTPDAAFIAVPNVEAPRTAAALLARGGGGFVCFSAGFSETGTAAGDALTNSLVDASGTLPFFGPNCYGFVNFFDRVAMMPDQIVGCPVDRGVALICQSGTIALTLMYNARSLPIGYLFSVGNQTRLSVEDLIETLCHEDRVSAFGLYLEGIKDPQRFAQAAAAARAAGKPIALIKAGRTGLAARTARSHTGAMVGSDAVFDAFCRQAGIARCETLGVLCETLKLFHTGGALRGSRVLMIGASGGDMAMTADVSRKLALDFSPIPEPSVATLQALLGHRVTVANPLDIQTYLWFDPAALKTIFHEALRAGYDAVGFMLDCPPQDVTDTSAFDAVIDAFIAAAQGAASRAALIASLPETMGLRVRQRCLAGGVVPLQGQLEALEALSLAGVVGLRWLEDADPVLHRSGTAGTSDECYSLREDEGKSALNRCGVRIPRGRTVAISLAATTAANLGYPVVMKVADAGVEHKSDTGGVLLNIRSDAEATAAQIQLGRLTGTVLVEEMLTGAVGEVLAGVVVDPQFGQTLVLASGGIFTELLDDAITLLPPWTAHDVETALHRLKVAKLFAGYRGRPPADVPALIEAILGVARYAEEHMHEVVEIDVNPIIVLARGLGAVAVDSLIRLKKPALRSRP